MFDTHAIARQLTGAGLTVEQADAITDAVRQAAEHGDHVTPERFDGGLAQLEARLAWRLITAGIAIAGIAVAAAVTLTVTMLRLLLAP
ncbi:MAG: hypothetical protein OXH04_18020 [Acidobacteria bacterium]|nr:hypothetical protein [Acidobacteriota bacterium]